MFLFCGPSEKIFIFAQSPVRKNFTLFPNFRGGDHPG
jgi:hypothetical protein